MLKSDQFLISYNFFKLVSEMTEHRNRIEAKGRRNRVTVTEDEGKHEENKANQKLKREKASWLRKKKAICNFTVTEAFKLQKQYVNTSKPSLIIC